MFKTEVISKNNPFHQSPYKSIDDVEYPAMEWVDWYNRARLHSRLNDVTPDEFEAAHYAQTTDTPAAAVTSIRAARNPARFNGPPAHFQIYPCQMAVGTVLLWHAAEGWGVIESAETAGGCWFYFSHLWKSERPQPRPGYATMVRGGARTTVAGETVDFEWEPVGDQDGYAFRATTVNPRRESPPWTAEYLPEGGGSFAAALDVTFDDPQP